MEITLTVIRHRNRGYGYLVRSGRSPKGDHEETCLNNTAVLWDHSVRWIAGGWNKNCSLDSPLTNRIAGGPVKNDEMQGARILRNEAYSRYAAMTKDETSRQRREGGSRFSTTS